MRWSTRTTGLVAVVLTAGCTGDRSLSGPSLRPAALLSLTGTGVVRVAPAFVETGRYFLQGTHNTLGGCHFNWSTSLPAGRMRRETIVESKQSTCEAIVALREDPYSVDMRSAERGPLSPSAEAGASALLRPGVANLTVGGDSASQTLSTNLTYGPPGTNGFAFQDIFTGWYMGGFPETRDRVSIAYTKNAGCIQTARLQNYAWWRRGASTVFSWGLTGFTYPANSGDPCGTLTVSGTAQLGGGMPDDCYVYQQVYTDYDTNQLNVLVSAGTATFGANVDIYTGNCYLTWNRNTGTG